MGGTTEGSALNVLADGLTVPRLPDVDMELTRVAMAKRKAAENQPEATAPFEDSLAELQVIVSELEEGSLGLEMSLSRFERGIGLLRQCYAVLESAEARVEILTRFQGDAAPSTASFESEATFDSTLGQVNEEDGPAEINSDGDRSSLF